MKNLVFSLIYLALFLYSYNAYSQAGSLDPTFGVNGTVISDFGGGSGSVSELSSLPDGKVRIGGNYTHNDKSQFMILQYFPDGKPDLSFGSAGRIFTDLYDAVEYRTLPDGKFRVYGFGAYFDSTEFVIQQFLPDGTPDLDFGPTGKIFPGHTWFGVNYPIQSFYIQSDLKIVFVLQGDDFILARLLPDGQPDLSFGNTGVVKTDLGQIEFCNTIYEQEDGKLLAAGRSGTFLWWSFTGSSAIVRYLPDGNLDTTFGENGIVLGNLDGVQNNILEVQDDQKILALAGSPGIINGVSGPLVMIRYTNEGKIDSSFATNGKLNLPERIAYKLKVLQDGNILLLCSKVIRSDPFGYPQYGLPLAYRYSPDGQLDPEFGYNGYDSTRIAVSDMLIREDNKLMLCGSYDGDAMLFRYLPDGQVDFSFGENGLLMLHFGKNSTCQFVFYQTDGSLLLAGTKSEITYDSDIILAKRLSDGSPDSDFGSAETPGKVIVDFGMDNHVVAEAMAIQSNGNIAVAGSIVKNMVLFQFKPDGTPDPEFAENGYRVIADPIEFKYQLYKTIYQDDGKIVLGGVLQDTGYNKILLTRLNAGGSKDGQFGEAGLVIADFGNIGIQRITSISITPEGEIYIAGTILHKDQYPFVAKIFPNGGLDNSFGTNGIALLSEYQNTTDPNLKLFKNGRILLAAKVNDKLNLIRLLSDGNADLGFGDNGKIINEFSSADQTAAIIRIQEDNKFIVGGMGYANGIFLFSCKYQENGMPDPTFGQGGKVIYPLSGTYFFFFDNGSKDILQQTDGKIIFSGSIEENASDLELIRLDKNGALDSTFGNQGFVQTDLGSTERVVQATLQNDNKILLAGTKMYNIYSSIVLVRYLNDLGTALPDVTDTNLFGLQVYPNPASGNLNIAFREIDKNVVITITDLSGQVVFRKTVSPLQNTIVNTDGFSAGLYFIHVQTENNIQTKKVFISK